MATVKILSSKTAGHVPTALVDGQIAINEADWILYWPDNNGTVQSFNLKTPSANTSPVSNDNSTKLATTAWVNALAAAITGTPPTGLTTLADLAAAINDDDNFSTTINNALSNRLRFDATQTLNASQVTQAVANLGIFNRTAVGDANITILNTARELNITAVLTATRTYTLPLANTVTPGTIIPLVDEIGNAVGSTNTLQLQPQAGNFVNGLSSGTALVIDSPFRMLWIECDGNTKWTIHLPGVRFDAAQSLSSTDSAPGGVAVPSEQTQARRNLYAAPFDAMAYLGMTTNVSMGASQLNGSTAITVGTGSGVNFQQIVDGWGVLVSGSAIVSAQQVSDAPPGYLASLKISVTTAESTLGTGDCVTFQTKIEGLVAARLMLGNALCLPHGMCFWFKAHRTGTYSVSIGNANYGGTYATYIGSFSYTASDTWQYVRMYVPPVTFGSWNFSNAQCLVYDIALAAGTSVLQTAGSWYTGNYLGATGQVNGVAATTDYAQLTGFNVYPGVELPSQVRAPDAMRLYPDELAYCQRYFNAMYVAQAMWAGDGNLYEINFNFPPMRTTPSASFVAGSTAGTNNASGYPQVVATSASRGQMILEAAGWPAFLYGAGLVALNATM